MIDPGKVQGRVFDGLLGGGGAKPHKQESGLSPISYLLSERQF